MTLTLISTDILQKKDNYEKESENFKYVIAHITGNGTNELRGSVFRDDRSVATVSKFNESQSNFVTEVQLTTEEKIEIISAFDGIIAELNNLKTV